ncbi:hypothetical protein [Murimonas intestini]|uniref:Uncharacterized protein n=1 Tax=Murimonas intestini TaxID=1337051 RepID=A0AB73T1C6_9FIRM|nr:hypothetical protein [Murimonas intestini]MCR1840466.1 hypothetical protein [Murimonas intestini]MCR1867423.1 hypothetical protein [Murimonas intestini]MCR1884610.1 hypothetical protein [Murimonas intestini]
MQENIHIEKERPLLHKRNYLVTIILSLILFLFLISIGAIWFSQRESARRVLKEAKLVHLAVKMTALEYYGLNQSFYDPESSNGFEDGVVDELKKVTGCNGDIYLVDWDLESFSALHLLYIQDGFAVDYRLVGDEDIWNVYEFKHVIMH